MKKLSYAIILSMITSAASSQLLAGFDLDLPVNSAAMDLPVTLNLPTKNVDWIKSELRLRTASKKNITLPHQFDASLRQVSFILPADFVRAGGKQRVELVKAASAPASILKAVNKDGNLTIQYGAKNLLRYVHKTTFPPAGIDTNYKRSGFIHPLWTPHGQELTRIQPPDHYHHYGIWNPWTHTLFENDTVDFWNIKGRKGTVRFAKFNKIIDGPIFTAFQVLHEHIVFKKDGNEKKALNELQTIKVYKPAPANDYYFVDITSELSCASSSPLLILAYRYGGLGWRATEVWDKSNSEMLTSEGNTRKTTDGSKARWCIVQGKLGEDYGGAAMMSHPSNYNHPEPLRIWDENANGGRGDVFANFAPTKDKDWLLEPGKTYVLKYRLLVFNGKMDAVRAETAWQYFAHHSN